MVSEKSGSSAAVQATTMQKIVVGAHIYENVLTVGRVPVADRDAWWQVVVHENRLDGFFDSFVDGLSESFQLLCRNVLVSVGFTQMFHSVR